MRVSKGEFFLEVRCEEIPARMLNAAMKKLASGLFEELLACHLAPSEGKTGFTPRRLAIALSGIPAAEPDREQQVTGPPADVGFDADGQPTAAALGFAKRCGVDSSALRRIETEKGDYLSAIVRTEGKPAPMVLAEITPRVLKDLPWPKVMRWGGGEGPWARPIHGIVALYDGVVVPFELFGISTGSETAGHPILSPREFSVSGFADYSRKLGRRKIVIRFEERKKKLASALRKEAERLGGRLVEDETLLDQLTAMCGTPGVVSGSFDPTFLELPREVLVTTLRDHQSAFSVEAGGALLPSFLTLMDRPDDPEGRIRAGNEWVVAARLADASFFFAEDRKVPLRDRKDDLARLTFHVKLGSYAEKSQRIVRLCRVLGEVVGWEAEAAAAEEAAQLLKVDLTTEMVKEFTSLQGIMGGLYSRLEGEREEVWKSIYEQYLPAATDDPIPSTRVGRLVGLADRIDSLVGILGLGHVPSGSKDPFGLRRAAQAVVRIALEGGLAVDLDLVAAKAYQGYGGRLELDGKEVLAVWRPFLADRVRHLFGLAGFAYDEIEAALEVAANNLPDLRARVDALHQVREEEGFLSVVLAAKRIANILRDTSEQAFKEELLTEDAEQRLYQAFLSLKSEVEGAEAEGRYEQCLRAMTGFAEVLDRFFVEVLVMDENLDLRNNRIAMLQSIRRVLSRTAELTAVVVERKVEEESDG
jgi:glycyl-tRNA synthetase beta chain